MDVEAGVGNEHTFLIGHGADKAEEVINHRFEHYIEIILVRQPRTAISR